MRKRRSELFTARLICNNWKCANPTLSEQRFVPETDCTRTVHERVVFSPYRRKIVCDCVGEFRRPVNTESDAKTYRSSVARRNPCFVPAVTPSSKMNLRNNGHTRRTLKDDGS